jgi:DNA repair protein RadD
MVLAHRKELLEQNAEKIKSLLPLGITCGLFSAGLRRFAMDDHVICAGIQSVYKRAADFGRRHLIIIDETHLVPDDNDGMYRKFIGDLGELNPRLKIIGLTATPYRTSTGTICGADKLFNGVCYSAKIPNLIAGNYLCPVTTEITKEIYDTSKLHTRAGEFIASEVETLFDDDGKTREACEEIIIKCYGRKSILIFSSGVQHAEHIAKIIEANTGEKCGIVTGNTIPLERSATLAAFKAQQLRWLVNVDVLTTGFDAPCIDAIAVLRATQSPGLFAQICGRGFRLHPSKQDCLVVDYGNNIKRHGPIDSDSYGQKNFSAPRENLESNQPGEGKKQCPACNCWVPNAMKVCECSWLFSSIDSRADTQSQILAKPEKWKVLSMHLSRHRKKSSVDGKPDTLRVSYEVEPENESGDISRKEISEWICLEHEGFAGKKAWKWVMEMTDADIGDPPIDSVIDLFKRGALAQVHTITTMQDGKWHRVIEREIGDKPQDWQEDKVQPVDYDEWGEPIYEEAKQAVDDDIPF